MEFTYQYLTEEKAIAGVLKQVTQLRSYLVLDLETTSLNTRQARIVDIGILGKDDKEVILFPGEFAYLLKEVDPFTTLVGHNLLRYDIPVLYHNKIDMTGYEVRDTMILDYLNDENNKDDLGLESVVARLFGKDKYKDDFWDKYDSYEEAPVEVRQPYAASDIYWTNLVYKKEMEKLGRQYEKES